LELREKVSLEPPSSLRLYPLSPKTELRPDAFLELFRPKIVYEHEKQETKPLSDADLGIEDLLPNHGNELASGIDQLIAKHNPEAHKGKVPNIGGPEKRLSVQKTDETHNDMTALLDAESQCI